MKHNYIFSKINKSFYNKPKGLIFIKQNEIVHIRGGLMFLLYNKDFDFYVLIQKEYTKQL